MSEEAEASAASAGFGKDQDVAVKKAEVLANLVLSAPERFASGDQHVVQGSLDAMKAILDFAFHTEAEAVASLSKYLGPALEDSQMRQTRAGKGNKRKRGQSGTDHGSLFAPTELDEFTVENLTEDQLWNQIELKNEKMNAFLDAAMVETSGEDEELKMLAEEEDDEDRDVLDELQKKRRKEQSLGSKGSGDGQEEDDEDDDEDDAAPHEKVVHSIKSLTDAELRALGLDPSRRKEFEAFAEEEGMEDDDEEEEEEDEEDKYGYAGASDLSDDDEMHGKTVVEPLRTEEQQRKRQAQIAAEEKQKALRQLKLRKMMGIKESESEDEEEEDDSDDDDDDEEDTDFAGEEEDEDEDEGEEEDEDADSSDESEEDSKAQAERKRLSSLLDNLDAPGSNTSNGKKWKKHPTLDDSFFSIDQFNKDTDDYGDEGIDLGEDVDLFRPIEEEGEEEPILYSDFFAPPPGGVPKAKEAEQGKADSADASLSASDKENVPEKASLVRFHDKVTVRHIKARRKNEMEITPELLQALQKADAEQAGQEEADKDAEEDDDESEDEDEESDEEHSGMGSESDGEDGDGMDVDESEEEDEEEEGDDDVNGDEAEEGGDASEEEQETAHRVAGDLFEEEPDEAESGKEQRSSYERRLETLQQEIARLEQENVGKKDWTLMGETGSRARPENSLLAESLDFENNQRAKPIITQETTSTLEDLIRKRILESNFDDVERRANMQQFDFMPSKMLELSDSKSSRSLDQVYEDEMGMSGAGSSHGEKMDKQLAKDHEEISRLYDELEYKLDALSNAHFTPKAPRASIQTISNAPTITLEESLPSTSNYASQLAPEEVYDAGRHNVALQGDRSEMTPEEKKRLQKQLRADKRARNERIESVKRNVEINKEAFGKNRGGKFVGSGRKGSRNDAKEKEEALHKLMGNKGVSVVGKGNEGKKKKKDQQDAFALNASHLKL